MGLAPGTRAEILEAAADAKERKGDVEGAERLRRNAEETRHAIWTPYVRIRHRSL